MSQDIENGVAGEIFTSRNMKGSMGKPYLYSTRREQNIVVFLHIYGARVIFLLFWDNQDTGSESRKI